MRLSRQYKVVNIRSFDQRPVRFVFFSNSHILILSNGQFWKLITPLCRLFCDLFLVHLKLDFFSNRLLDLVDMPKQYLHLEAFKIRYSDKKYIISLILLLGLVVSCVVLFQSFIVLESLDILLLCVPFPGLEFLF